MLHRAFTTDSDLPRLRPCRCSKNLSCHRIAHCSQYRLPVNHKSNIYTEHPNARRKFFVPHSGSTYQARPAAGVSARSHPVSSPYTGHFLSLVSTSRIAASDARSAEVAKSWRPLWMRSRSPRRNCVLRMSPPAFAAAIATSSSVSNACSLPSVVPLGNSR